MCVVYVTWDVMLSILHLLRGIAKMTPEFRLKCRSLIIKHEEYRKFPYVDTTGHLTIGYGHNLQANGLSQPISLSLLDEDMSQWVIDLDKKLPIYSQLSPARQSVLIDMCHNLGLQGVLEFKEMIDALEKGNYELAAQCMLESKWAVQVGERAAEDAYIMKTGEL